MKDTRKNKKNNNENFSNVEKEHDILIPEEFPEGPVGSPFHEHEKVQGKSTEWEEGQRHISAFSDDNKK